MSTALATTERLAEMLDLSTSQHDRKYNVGKILGIWVEARHTSVHNEIVVWASPCKNSVDEKGINTHQNYVSTVDFGDNVVIHFAVPAKYEDEWKEIYARQQEKKQHDKSDLSDKSKQTDVSDKKYACHWGSRSSAANSHERTSHSSATDSDELKIELRPQRAKKAAPKASPKEKKQPEDGDRDSQLCTSKEVPKADDEDELDEEYMAEAMTRQYEFPNTFQSSNMKIVGGNTCFFCAGSTGEWSTVEHKKKKTVTDDENLS